MQKANSKLAESTLGPGHTTTLSIRNGLAAAYWSARRTSETITLLEDTLKLRETTLGPDHPETLESRNNLATVVRSVGRTSEAIKLYKANLQSMDSTHRS